MAITERGDANVCKTKNRALTKDEYVKLKISGMFGVFYPECCGNWEIDKLLWEEA